MHSWRAAMPKGMFLKSSVGASNLSDPDGACTLERYYVENGAPSNAKNQPIPVETFVQYGLSFQRCIVPELEETTVAALNGCPSGFEIHLVTGERVIARRVVLALGTTYFKHVPDALAALPGGLASHSADHRDLGVLGRREVVVIGRGQSALETAALLNEQGAKVSLVVRAPSIVWGDVPLPHPTLLERLRRPRTGLGLGWRLWFYSNGPGMFQYLPEDLRIELVKRELGPAGAPWLKDRVMERFPVLQRHVLREAHTKGERVCLSLVDCNGKISEISADHVIAATGFKVDVRAISFLSADLLRRLELVRTTPALSSNFESSIPGLYFVGLASAYRFGPSMRFVLGAAYTARRIVRALSVARGDRSEVRATTFGEAGVLEEPRVG